TASFTPQVIAGAGSSQLTVTTLPAAPGGTYPLTITGTAGGVTHAVAVTLVVSARDFALSVSPSSATISRGKSAKYTVGVSVIGGSVGNVSLTVAGLPAGTTAGFSPNPVRSPRPPTTPGKAKDSAPARDLPAADHRDQRGPGSSGHRGAHRPVGTRTGRPSPRSADEGQGGPGVVEEPVVTGDTRERLARPGDPGPGAVRPGQRAALRGHGDQLIAVPQQHRPVPPGGGRHPPRAPPPAHRGRVRRLPL